MTKEKKTLAGVFAASMVTVRHPIELPAGEGTVTLFVRELGYLELQEAYATARITGQSAMGLLVAVAVEDADGSRFTYAEAMSLRREIAAPLFADVAKTQRIGEADAKN